MTEMCGRSVFKSPATPREFNLDLAAMDSVLAVLQFPPLNPVIVEIGPFVVRWYGAAYLLSFLIAYLFLIRMVRTGIVALSPQQIGDLVNWLVAGVVLGGRLGWWVFYHRSEGAVEPWYEPVAIWHGGMSFHGGLLGVVAALALWAKRNRGSFWDVADALALCAPIGLFLGRIANFINAELVGRESALPWAVVFPGESVARHPSQLYEAMLEGPILLLLLWFLFHNRSDARGRVAIAFLTAYGLIRFAVEFTRQPDAQLGFIAFGWLTMGQILSLLLAAVGGLAFAVAGGRSSVRYKTGGRPRHRLYRRQVKR